MFTNQNFLIFQWSMVSFTFLLVCLRMYLRVWLRARFSWSDFFVILAWLFFVNESAIITLIIHARKQLAIDRANNDQVSLLKHMTSGLKVQFSFQLTYYFTLFCIKFSMLCFYNEFIARHILPKCWIAIRVIFAFCAGCLAWAFFGFLLWCQPISGNWNVEHYCNAGDALGFETPLIIVHMGTDFAIYVIPLYTLKQMQILSLRQRLGAGVLFGVGFLTILAGASIFGIGFAGTDKGLWTLTLACTEQALAIVVACGPSFRSLLLKSVKGIRTKQKSTSIIDKWRFGSIGKSSGKSQGTTIVDDTATIDGGLVHCDEKGVLEPVQRQTLEEV